MYRRQVLTGLISLIAAPAIVRAGSLMPVKALLADPYTVSYWWKQAGWRLGDAGNWEHFVIRADGPFEAKRYVNGVLEAEGRIADLKIYEGKQLIEWYPLDGLVGNERGPLS